MNLRYDKYQDRLVPAIVQDARTGTVLMLGFMNDEALRLTEETGLVTFYSRSRQRIWVKGETSGNTLSVSAITADCDDDSILITAVPAGPVCHTGSGSCFEAAVDAIAPPEDKLTRLEGVIDARRSSDPAASYVAGLFADGINRVAQKVGEEAVEMVIAAKDNDAAAFTGEAADLLFHYLILLRAKGVSIVDVLRVLDERKR